MYGTSYSSRRRFENSVILYDYDGSGEKRKKAAEGRRPEAQAVVCGPDRSAFGTSYGSLLFLTQFQLFPVCYVGLDGGTCGSYARVYNI